MPPRPLLCLCIVVWFGNVWCVVWLRCVEFGVWYTCDCDCRSVVASSTGTQAHSHCTKCPTGRRAPKAHQTTSAQSVRTVFGSIPELVGGCVFGADGQFPLSNRYPLCAVVFLKLFMFKSCADHGFVLYVLCRTWFGHSVSFSGGATRGRTSKTFRWTFFFAT